MIEIKRKEKESTASVLRRFSKKIRQSGVLLTARKKMHYEKTKTKRAERASALRREQLKTLRSWLIKTGALAPDEKIDLSKINEEQIRKMLRK